MTQPCRLWLDLFTYPTVAVKWTGRNTMSTVVMTTTYAPYYLTFIVCTVSDMLCISDLNNGQGETRTHTRTCGRGEECQIMTDYGRGKVSVARIPNYRPHTRITQPTVTTGQGSLDPQLTSGRREGVVTVSN